MSSPSITCPTCKFRSPEVDFFRCSDHGDGTVMYKIPSGPISWRNLFQHGPKRSLYACPKCGIAFIIP